MKRTIATGVAGLVLGFGAAQKPVASPLEKIEQAQAGLYAQTGSYVQCHEYQTPSGERGYQIIYTDGDTTISKGTGPEAKDRTFSETKPKFKTSTTTP